MESIFGPIYEAIGWLLSVFYSVIPNLGVSIILLTFTIMLILYPLTAKQARSMIAMQRVQPEIKKLQAKYKNDRQKLNEEMMAFYKENKINPLAGCLPLLVQMPIFISLFQVLRNPEKWIPTDSSLYAALCSTADGVIRGVEACAKNVNHLTFLGIDLQLSATDAHDSAIDAIPYFVLVGLVILTGFLQTRQAQKRTPAANKQMGMVMRVLTIFFGLISLQFPAGLVLYFFISNLWRLGQQEVIFRQFGSTLKAPGKAGAIDVASKDRSAKAKTAVAELEQPADDADEDDVVDVSDDAPPSSAPVAKQQPSSPAAGGAPARPAPAKAKGGLRGLFQLPPPPEPNGGAAPAAAKPQAQRPSSTSGSGRPPQQRRKRNKKKRKR